MKIITRMAAGLALLIACAAPAGGPGPVGIPAISAGARPGLFPARIWAACDFELLQKDVLWGGRTETVNILRYPANSAAGAARPDGSGRVRLNVLPADYPRASGSDLVYFRYYLTGASAITLSLYNLDRQDFHRLQVTGLAQGEWAEAVADFKGVGPEGGGEPIAAGERILDVAFEAGAEGGEACELIIDDVICFEPAADQPGQTEPFPRRVIRLWSFDPVDYYHPWTHTDYRIVQSGGNLPNDWGVARSLAGDGKDLERIRLIVDPPKAVGEMTRFSFDCFLNNVSRFQPMIFDLADMDNRHVVLENLEQGRWRRVSVDFTADGIKNDGNQTPFRPGNRVDDLFFLVWPAAGGEPEFLIDNAVLYDAGQ